MTNIGVIDLFCGIGGLSYGLQSSGMKVRAGFDLDSSCKYAFEANNDAPFIDQDVSKVTGEQLSDIYGDCEVKVLAGCAPCQPFSSYAFKNKQKDRTKYSLLYEFSRLISEVNPDVITMENVLQILSFKEQPVLEDFISKLKKLGYSVSVNKVYCPDYGIPQTRKRLVLLASKLGDIALIKPTHSPKDYVTVRSVIASLKPIKSGEQDENDPLHVARTLSPVNLKRIELTPYGGGWKDWPDELKLECHKRPSGRSFGSVYGRMVWDQPAPTMTTLCTGLGNGRFGHPVQNRAISVREAALFQTFPISYEFFKPDQEISVTALSRQIGNAVPPRLGYVIGKSIIEHIESK